MYLCWYHLAISWIQKLSFRKIANNLYPLQEIRMEEDGQMSIDTFTRCLLILLVVTISIDTIIQLQEHEDEVPTGDRLGGVHRRWQNCSDCHHH